MGWRQHFSLNMFDYIGHSVYSVLDLFNLLN